ncbi:MAG: hypothetical protein ACFB01_14615 [Cohaesibacteraceae bacterium]
MTQLILFAACALLSFAWFLVHLLMGGKEVARPLLAADLPDIVLQTLYLCWHFTSASIAAMAAFFAMAIWFGTPPYAVAGTLLAAAFVLVGVVIAPLKGWRYRTIPQGWLFVPIAAMGVAGLMLG